ncbi:MAG TPA: type II toxin-antitoxin system HicB family antitoxin [Hanamia sp.]
MKTKYEIVIYWSNDDNCFIAEVPELSGCKSDGKTYAEALQNLEIIISEWIETANLIGRDIPKPRGKLMYA